MLTFWWKIMWLLIGLPFFFLELLLYLSYKATELLLKELIFVLTCELMIVIISDFVWCNWFWSLKLVSSHSYTTEVQDCSLISEKLKYRYPKKLYILAWTHKWASIFDCTESYLHFEEQPLDDYCDDISYNWICGNKFI